MRVDPRPLLPTALEKSASVEGVPAVVARQGSSFEALLNRREALARRSLRGDVERSGSSSGVNPELFGCTRSVEILEYLLTEVLPGLGADPEIQTLAEDLIREEIHMRQSLEQQRAEVQA